MTTKQLVILSDIEVHDKLSQLRKYGIDIFVSQADLVHQHNHDPPPSDHTAVGRSPRALPGVYQVRTTAALYSS